MRQSPLTEFALLARLPDDALDLERLVLAIARMGAAELDTRAVSAELDALAARVAEDIDTHSAPDRLARDLARAIGSACGFQGTADAYSTPAGSYLDQVVTRKTGLPILLAIVWVLLGRRLGVAISGVGYPGHFLARLDTPGASIYLDPFRGGAPVEAADLLDRLPSGVDRGALEPASTRSIVSRVLTNLKHLQVGRQDHTAALDVVDRILLIAGEVPPELRDRGLLLAHMGRGGEAIRDLTRYLTLTPSAYDRARVEAVLSRLRREA